MDKRYHVNGIFSLEVEADEPREAKGKVERILKNSGIDGYVVEIREVRSVE